LGGGAYAGARERALRPPWRSRRLVASRQGPSLPLRLQRPRRHTLARADRAVEPARARDRLRTRARTRPSRPRRRAARVFGTRRAPPHVLARRSPDGRPRVRRLVLL